MVASNLSQLLCPASFRVQQLAKSKRPVAFSSPVTVGAKTTKSGIFHLGWSIIGRQKFRFTSLLSPNRVSSSRAARHVTRAGWNDFEWSEVKLATKVKAAEELFSITLDVSQEDVEAYTRPGQFVQLRTSPEGKAAFIAIASAPELHPKGAQLELLVKPVEGSTTQDICNLAPGGTLEMSPVMGKGFDMSKAPTDAFGTILIFATGSGISPIKALIEAPVELGGLDASSREDVRLYYGAKDEDHMAFKERFGDWAERGVTVVPVYSQRAEGPKYVQDAFQEAAAEMVMEAKETAVVLCGQKEMAQAVTDIVGEIGISGEQLLTNF
mmetsp:Transcript_9082/g.12340  ORF Transcript_9082/g.12340 Transcript_9082/m.12340 type:complete len:325 (+) Transcript_9082:111-1085(+)|eukprot:CAMPEP_0196572396 /NCGR_PEP_ID=MMETSP1081-20130531/2464_1 /TAXON_ID=36882 /ORGANISM="Pyramimonas amylifera, Strain CCMP720" /LENGTH=324 /DNA_ID=CAMNT_0041889713 /DNA_START=111 /DNA_END=1085 /DNA_ORIENTATION=-